MSNVVIENCTDEYRQALADLEPETAKGRSWITAKVGLAIAAELVEIRVALHTVADALYERNRQRR